MSTTIKKRHREQTRQERQQNKDARQAQRKTEKPVPAHSDSQEDPDLAGMVAGPQGPTVAFAAERSIPLLQDKWLFQ